MIAGTIKSSYLLPHLSAFPERSKCIGTLSGINCISIAVAISGINVTDQIILFISSTSELFDPKYQFIKHACVYLVINEIFIFVFHH